MSQFCITCGRQLEPNWLFCRTCGTEVVAAPLADLPNSTVVEQPNPGAVEPEHVPETSAPSASPNEEPVVAGLSIPASAGVSATDADTRVFARGGLEWTDEGEGVPPAPAAVSMRQWWWAPALLGALILVGGFLPFWSISSKHIASDATGVGVVLGFAGIAMLAAIDTARGNDAGLSAAAGFAVMFSAIVGVILVVLFEVNDALSTLSTSTSKLSLGAGGWCWVLAAIVGLVLVVPGCKAIASTAARGRINDGLAFLIGIAGVVLLVGLCISPIHGMSLKDHLFGSSLAGINVAVGVLLGTTAIVAVLVVIRGTTGAVMAALGVGGYWLIDWAFSSAGFGSSGASFVSFLNGQFAVVTIGLFSFVGLSVFALLQASASDATKRQFNPSDAPQRSLPQRAPLTAIVGLLAGLVLLISGLAHHSKSTADYAYATFGSGVSGGTGFSYPQPTTTVPSDAYSSATDSTTQDEAGSGRSTTETETSTTAPADSQARDLHELLVEMISKSGQARSALRAAVQNVDSCNADPNSAAADADTAATTRRDILTQLDNVDTSELPNGSELLNSLRTAMSSSANADDRYAAWMRWVGSVGCSAHAPHNDDFTAAQSSDAQATASKKEFIGLWNPIAGQYGYPQLTEFDL